MALIASARERPFGLDELFLATTDGAGRIRIADPVFARLTGCAGGEPYEEFRHPELPRGVLRELFGPAPAAAYVKHLAQDGAFFWALVLVLPAGDGHLVVGFKPDGGSFDAARERYQALRAAELDGEDVSLA